MPKTTESGDFIIEWKGIKFMFENKKVQKTVQKPEVDEAEVNKAVRDFNAKNQNCDVLVFVSEDIAISPIASIILTLLTKMGDRPAIWIGEFYFKRRQSRLSGIGAEKLPKSSPACKKKNAKNKFESGDEIVDYKNKVDDLIQLFNITKVDLDKLL